MHRLLSVAIALATALPAAAGERLAGRAHVLDGDTIVVGGIHVRLKGVAAPEVAHYDQPAAAFSRSLRRYGYARVSTYGQTLDASARTPTVRPKR